VRTVARLRMRARVAGLWCSFGRVCTGSKYNLAVSQLMLDAVCLCCNGTGEVAPSSQAVFALSVLAESVCFHVLIVVGKIGCLHVIMSLSQLHIIGMAVSGACC
jgi:hypothetical protein